MSHSKTRPIWSHFFFDKYCGKAIISLCIETKSAITIPEEEMVFRQSCFSCGGLCLLSLWCAAINGTYQNNKNSILNRKISSVFGILFFIFCRLPSLMDHHNCISCHNNNFPVIFSVICVFCSNERFNFIIPIAVYTKAIVDKHTVGWNKFQSKFIN